MTAIDWWIVAAYFGILVVVVWWATVKNRATAADYFLAGRGLGWVVVGASIFASNIGSEHVVGLAVLNNYTGGYWEDRGYNWFSGL